MTDNEIQIAIAEVCGWREVQICRRDGGRWPKGAIFGTHPNGHLAYLPNYLKDLDAIHEAEAICIRGHYDMEYREHLEKVMNEGYSAIIYASARQRAIALVHTVGKWKD